MQDAFTYIGSQEEGMCYRVRIALRSSRMRMAMLFLGTCLLTSMNIVLTFPAFLNSLFGLDYIRKLQIKFGHGGDKGKVEV